MTYRFTAPLEQLSAKGGAHLVVVPAPIADAIRGEHARGRAVVTLVDASGAPGPTWHAGLNPYGPGRHYIQVGRNYHEPLGLGIGDRLTVELRRDDSDYGMQPCEEYDAVAASDPAGTSLFRQRLTSGTQRSILHRIANGRTPDARIERALRIFDLLHLGVTERKALLASISAAAMRGDTPPGDEP